jgi:hypothetical protein
MLLGGLVLIGVAVVVEQRAGEPIIPITLFKNSTVVLASVASILVGSSLYGVTVLLSQYFQIARAKSPTASGLSTIPLILGMFLTSHVVGRVITRVITKDRAVESVPLGASIALVAGLAILGPMRAGTSYPVLAAGMLLAGVGMGATMQNLVLAAYHGRRGGGEPNRSASSTLNLARCRHSRVHAALHVTSRPPGRDHPDLGRGRRGRSRSPTAPMPERRAGAGAAPRIRR